MTSEDLVEVAIATHTEWVQLYIVMVIPKGTNYKNTYIKSVFVEFGMLCPPLSKVYTQSNSEILTNAILSDKRLPTNHKLTFSLSAVAGDPSWPDHVCCEHIYYTTIKNIHSVAGATKANHNA